MADELSDAELGRLDGFLSRVVGGAIPNTEALDGFCAAMACCPDLIMPGEFLAVLSSGDTGEDDLVFEDSGEAQEFVGLVMRHWNYVTARLSSGEVYLPLLRENSDGIAMGNDWGKGFVTGTHLRGKIWSDLLHDEEWGGPLVSILALAYEHHPDPEMRPFKEPISAERREALIVSAAASVMRIHDMFQPMRADYLAAAKAEYLATVGVATEPLLDLQRKRVHPASHVRDATGDPHLRPCRKRDHRFTINPLSKRAAASMSKSAGTVTRHRPPRSMVNADDRTTSAASGASARDEPSIATTRMNDARLARSPSRCLCRQS